MSVVGSLIPVAPEQLLIVTSDPQEGDRYASALMQMGRFAFTFARDAVSAAAYARSAPPDLAVISLPGAEGAALCRQIRGVPELEGARLLLVIDRQHVSAARDATANAVVLQPASALLVSIETADVLRRTERRSLKQSDRRVSLRGGRRLTDVRTG
jgi:DNA-binding response OmpR family regulator